MFSFRDMQRALREIGLEPADVAVLFAGTDLLAEVRGGPDTVLGAVLNLTPAVLTPAFTPQCAIVPPVGPPLNGLTYGDTPANALAEFFTPQLPTPHPLGEAMRHLPGAARSNHPLLSWIASAPAAALVAWHPRQQPQAPLVALLEKNNGVVVLLGVDHTANVAVHVAEQHSGRPGFTRWALTPAGIMPCAPMPGCARGFNALVPVLAPFTRSTRLGQWPVSAVRLADLRRMATASLLADPLALLCNQPDCLLCADSRTTILYHKKT